MQSYELQTPTSLKQAFQGLVPDGVSVVQGKVVGIGPLKIQAVNDDKLVISENILCLPRHLSTYQTTIDITLDKGSLNCLTKNGQGTHNHPDISEGGEHVHDLSTFNLLGAKMTIKNDLRIDDIVYLLSFNRGKKYYVLDREIW